MEQKKEIKISLKIAIIIALIIIFIVLGIVFAYMGLNKKKEQVATPISNRNS